MSLLGAFALALMVRLADLQVVHAAEHAQLIDRVAPRQIQYIRPARGSIVDRAGRPLITDVPCSDVTLYYRVLSGDPEYLRSLARRLRRDGEFPADQPVDEISPQLQQRIYEAVQTIARMTGMDPRELEQRRQRIVERVRKIRAGVERSSDAARKAGDENPWRPLVREESAWHALVENLPPQTAIALQLALGEDRWVRVQPGSERRAQRADSLGHLLGRMGAATRQRIDDDSERGDDLRAARGGDQCGVSGVELFAEHTLRGTRGRVVIDPNDGVVERVEPLRGADVRLTIDVDLQEEIYGILEEAAKRSEHPAGAAAVVIDVATREVLAAVSFPTYPFNEWRARYNELIRDTRHMPTKARALQVAYPPGSTCKAIAAIGALTDGAVAPSTRFHCTGHLLPDNTNRFRCWIYNQFSTTHDATTNPDGQDMEDAIRNSCNIYFFRLGEKLGPRRLCDWFAELGLGRSAGSGLIEESAGTVPTAEWLSRVAGRQFQRGDEWNWAIGQGEVTATPLQVANVAASIAAGEWRPVILARDVHGAALEVADQAPPRRLDTKALRPVRVGMWRVVNEDGGTAHPQATLGPAAAGYVFCGKTGSAQAQPLTLNHRYTVEWPDGVREEIVATTPEEALEQYGEDPPKIVGRFAHDRYPTLGQGDKLPAHAWFMGYTQSATVRPGDAPRERSYAISVLIEFGGAGGRVAGPVAKQIAEAVLRGPFGAG